MKPEKVLKLTRQLLQSACAESSPQAFLSEVSVVIFELACCDAIEITHHIQSTNYQWSTENSDGAHGKYQPISDKNDKRTLHVANIKSSGNHNPVAPNPSQLSIPFTLSDDNFGAITLTAARTDAFPVSLLPVLEELAQIFGWVASEHFSIAQLRESNRKQACLCQISRIIEQSRPFLEYYGKEGIQSLLIEMVKLLALSCQSANDIAIRIVLDDTKHTSEGFTTGQNIRHASISIAGKKRGSVEIHCQRDDAQEKCRLILPDEQNLVEEVAQLAGLLVEKHEATEAREQLQKQVHHADRLATIGELAAGVAHEINEPLGNILGFTQLVSQGLRDCDYKLDEIGAIQTKQDLERIEAATLHTREIVRDLLIFARQVPPKLVEIDLNHQLDLVVSFFLSRCAKACIQIKLRKADDLPHIIADPTQINQMMVNLITNAYHAMPEGGVLTIKTGFEASSVELPQPCLFLKISDTGVGISESIREKVFLPFFTTKDVKHGTGLGLSVVHSIVKTHGGKITMKSKVGKGTSFTVLLPLKKPAETNIGAKN